MVTSPYKWNILERDVKPKIINQSIWFHALPSLDGALHLSVVQINVERPPVSCRSMLNAVQRWSQPTRIPIYGLQSYSDLHNTNEYWIVSVLFRPLSKQLISHDLHCSTAKWRVNWLVTCNPFYTLTLGSTIKHGTKHFIILHNST